MNNIAVPARLYTPDTRLGRTARISALRPAYPLKAPAIAVHQLYYLPPGVNPKYPRKGWNIRTALLDFYSRIYKGLYEYTNLIEKSTFLEKLEQAYPNSVIFGLGTVGHRGRFRLRIDFYSDTWAMTFVLDRFDTPEIFQIAESLGLTSGLDPLDPFTYAKVWEYLFNGVWSDRSSPIGSIIQASDNMIGEKIYDGRTVVLDGYRGYLRDIDTLARDLQGASKHNEEINALRSQLEDDKAGVISDTLRKRISAFDFLVTLKGFIDFSASVGSSSVSEVVLCSMLHGDVLFGSAPPSADNARSFQSNMYVDCTRNSHQLGRLVRRVHVLEELKASALIDHDNGIDPDTGQGFKDIKKAERDLGKLWNDINEMPFDDDSGLANAAKKLSDISLSVDGGLIPRLGIWSIMLPL